MKLLLTSSGINNTSICNALVDLLGKPIAASKALLILTGIYPYAGGAGFAWQAINDKARSLLYLSDWKSLGLLELTALPSINKNIWIPSLQEADALLVWGGDVLYLSYWMQQSGLATLLPSLLRKMVYVGVSAGSMAVTSTIGEAYTNPPAGSGNVLTSEKIIFTTSSGEISRTFVTAHGVGLVDFAIIPHLDHPDHPDASASNAEKWASKLPVPVYAIDDDTAIKVVDDTIEIVSEGCWKLFNTKS